MSEISKRKEVFHDFMLLNADIRCDSELILRQAQNDGMVIFGIYFLSVSYNPSSRSPIASRL